MDRRSLLQSAAAWFVGLFCIGKSQPTGFRQFIVERDGVRLPGLKTLFELRAGDRFRDPERFEIRNWHVALSDPVRNSDGMMQVFSMFDDVA